MAWSHIGASNAAGTDSATPTLDAGTQAGDLLFIDALGSMGAVASDGYAQIRSTVFNAPAAITTLWKVATGAEGNPVVTGSGGIRVILSVSRSDVGTPSLDKESGQPNAFSASTTAPGVTVTNDESLAIHSAVNSGAATHLPPSGYTEADEIAGFLASSYDLDVSAGATGDVIGTLSGASANAAHLAVFTATAAGGGSSDGPRRGLLLPL